MHAKAVIRTAIAIPAGAAILVGTVIAPVFAFCEPSDVDYESQNPYTFDDGCIHGVSETVFTLFILVMALVVVSVIVSRGAD